MNYGAKEGGRRYNECQQIDVRINVRAKTLDENERDRKVHIDLIPTGRMHFFIKIIGLCFIARRTKASLACSHGVHRSPTLHILTNRKFSACLVLHTVRSGFSCSFLPHSISSDARTDESSDGAESSASL